MARTQGRKTHPRRSKVPSRPGSSRAKRGRTASQRYWSADVTKHSNALDLDKGVFALATPRRIARSLKRSAERSTRRKSSPFRSALSMLTFYVNRAGSSLGAARKSVLKRAKHELRRLYGRKP